MAQKKFIRARKTSDQQDYFDCLDKLSDALDSFNTIEPPSPNLKVNLPQVYKVVKDCYLLSARCYIKMDQQMHAKNCLKLILKVEPSDAPALFLRGQANEIRPDTAHQAILDYQRAYELLSVPGRSRTDSTLYKAVESKLRKAGDPSVSLQHGSKRPKRRLSVRHKTSHDSTGQLSSGHEPNTPDGVFEIQSR